VEQKTAQADEGGQIDERAQLALGLSVSDVIVKVGSAGGSEQERDVRDRVDRFGVPRGAHALATVINGIAQARVDRGDKGGAREGH
jgi:hypothetical protein